MNDYEDIDLKQKTILILGGTGMLGASLNSKLRSNNDHKIIIHGRTSNGKYNADISDKIDTYKLLDLVSPTVIINLIALTDVERCESHPNEAYLSNLLALENIEAWIKKETKPCYLIHISTDQVYSSNILHNENQVTLTNYYSFSKYAGELVAKNVPSTIIRTNFFGRSHNLKRSSITDWLFQSLIKNKPIEVFDDVMFNPLSMSTLSEMIELVIQKQPIGIFNLGSNEGMSKADFAFDFAGELNLPTNSMTRISIDEAIFLKTARPKNMLMDCSKFEKSLGLKLPSLRDEIKRVAKEYL